MLIPQDGLAQPRWEVISKQKGITVSRAQVTNRQFPSFKGVGVVQGDIYHVFAVLTDIDRHIEWMSHCSASRVLSKNSKTNWVIYNVTDAPWPVYDREAVMITEVNVNPDSFLITFTATKAHKMKPKKHTVRMNSFEGSYKLTSLSKNRTRVEYTINTDPGGSIPDWLVNLAVRSLPLETIIGLRDQIGKTKGAYEETISELKTLGEELLTRR